MTRHKAIGALAVSAVFAFALPFAADAFAPPLAATVGPITADNPVTGETETYDFRYIGDEGDWTVAAWEDAEGLPPVDVPQATGSAVWDSLLIDGRVTVTSLTSTAESVFEGWNFRVGLFNGADLTIPYIKYWNGGLGPRAVIDADSYLTIQSLGTSTWTTSVDYYIAGAYGLWYECPFSPNVNDSARFNYYFTGEGSAVYEAGITTGVHDIRQADAELSGNAKSVKTKALVEYDVEPTIAFVASDAKIVLKGVKGTAVKYLTSVTAANETSLTTADPVGTCELIQATNAVYLCWVDGSITDVVNPVYQPSISVNFTTGTGLSAGADVGVAPYAVPGTSWNNLVGNNGSLATVACVDAAGAATTVPGASVTISGTRGYWYNTGVPAATDLRNGYIDDRNNGSDTPTVVVEGIPYYSYKVVAYFSNNNNDTKFGYLTLNGASYKGEGGATVACAGEATDTWGAASTSSYAEGGNYLVSPTIVNKGGRLTAVSHDLAGCRAGLAAIQIVEVKPVAGEDELVIDITGNMIRQVDADAAYDKVYVTGQGSLSFTGAGKITAKVLDVSGGVTLLMDAAHLGVTDAVTGCGTVVYDGAQPDEDLGFDDAAWSGTVWVMNVGNGGTTSKVDAPLGTGSGASGTAAANNGLNKWGNANSSVKFTNVRGYVSNAACPWTLILEDDGDNYAWYNNNGWAACEVSFAALRGTGTFCDKSVDANPCRQKVTILDPSGFAGAMDVEGKRVGLGGSSTLASETASNGSIEIVAAGATLKGGVFTSQYGVVANGPLTVDGDISVNKMAVASTGTLTINAGKTLTQTARPLTIDGTAAIDGRLYCSDPYLSAAINGTVTVAGAFDSQGDVVIGSSGSVTVSGKLWANYGVAVNGDLSAPSLANLLSVSYSGEPEVTVNQGGVFTLTSTADVNDTDNGNVDYSRVKGTGTLKFYSTAGYRTFPSTDAKMPATTLTIQTEVADSLVITKNDGETAIGSLAGSKNIRSDWGANGANGRTLTVTQSKDTEWQGKFVSNRLTAFKVTGTGGELTLSGTFDSATAVPMTVESAGKVKLTGSYVGATTVAGTFGGSGTLTGNLTFSDGATFKAHGTSGLALSAGSAVSLPASGSVAVDVSAISNDITSAGVTLISSGVPGDITALSVDDAFYLASELGALKVYPVPDSPVAEYGGTSYYTFAEAIAAAAAAGGDIADITVLDATAPLPPAYKFVTDGATTRVAAYPVVLVTDGAANSYYDTVQEALIYIFMSLSGNYDYIEIVGGDSFVLPLGMLASINIKNTAAATAIPAGIADDCTMTVTPGETYTVYSVSNKPTVYTWTGNASVHRWGNKSNWSFVNDSSETVAASRTPEAGDSVVFTSAVSDLALGADTSVDSVSVGAEVVISREYETDVTLTATSGGIVLTDAGAAITVSGVALSPLPTTTVADSYVKVEATESSTRYSVAGYPVLALGGTAAAWSTGAWKIGSDAVAAPVSGPAKIVVAESTTLTVDAAVDLSELVVTGAVDKVLTLVAGSGSLVAQAVIVEGGVLQQGSASVLGASPSVVVRDGATFDLNGRAVNEANAFVLAGAGAGSWPWALTSSGGDFPTGTLRGFTLAGDATVGGANKIGCGKSGAASYLGFGTYTLTKTGSGELSFTNIRSAWGSAGSFDIAKGSVTLNEFTNLDGSSKDNDGRPWANTAVIIRSGASLTSALTDRWVWIGSLDLAGGTISTTGGYPFAIASAVTGSGTLDRVVMDAGALATLSGDLTVSTAMTLSGAMTFNKASTAENDVTVTLAGTLTAAGAITVGEGVTLNLGTNRPEGACTVDDGGVLAVRKSSAADVPQVKVSAQPAHVVLYDENGSVVSGAHVAYDSAAGTITIYTGNIWRAADGNGFDTPANWSSGSVPSSGEAATVQIADDTVITVSGTYSLGTLTISGAGAVSFTGSGSIAAEGVTLQNGASLKMDGLVSASTGIDVGTGSTLTIDAGEGTAAVAAAISGGGAVVTYGSVVLSGQNSMTGGITVKAGSSLSAGAAPVWTDSSKSVCTSAYGPYNKDWAYSALSRVTVEAGGCVDIDNVANKDVGVALTIAGQGILQDGVYSGVVKYSGASAIGDNSRQISSLTLAADAMIRLGSGWGLVHSGHSDALLDLGGHTLVVTGAATFPVAKVNRASGAATTGRLVLDGATLGLVQQASNLTGVDVVLRGAAQLNAAVAPTAIGSMTFLPTATAGVTATGWNLPANFVPAVTTANIDPAAVSAGQELTLFTAPAGTTLTAETITVRAGGRFTTSISGNTVTATVKAGIPQPFLHYDFNGEASAAGAKAADSLYALASLGGLWPTDNIRGKSGTASLIDGSHKPYYDSNSSGKSPFAAGEMTVTTLLKVKEADDTILWNLGNGWGDGMALIAKDSTTIAVVSWTGGASGSDVVSVTGIAGLMNKWHLVAVVASVNGTTLYVDGKSASAGTVLPLTIDGKGQFGSIHGTSKGYKAISGDGYLLDDWRVYDAELTEKEVHAVKVELNPDPLFIRLR